MMMMISPFMILAVFESVCHVHAF